MRNFYFKESVADTGIDVMIIFIVMVLLAVIAASFIIKTSTTLETQPLSTG